RSGHCSRHRSRSDLLDAFATPGAPLASRGSPGQGTSGAVNAAYYSTGAAPTLQMSWKPGQMLGAAQHMPLPLCRGINVRQARAGLPFALNDIRGRPEKGTGAPRAPAPPKPDATIG